MFLRDITLKFTLFLGCATVGRIKTRSEQTHDLEDKNTPEKLNHFNESPETSERGDENDEKPTERSNQEADGDEAGPNHATEEPGNH